MNKKVIVGVIVNLNYSGEILNIYIQEIVIKRRNHTYCKQIGSSTKFLKFNSLGWSSGTKAIYLSVIMTTKNYWYNNDEEVLL